MKFFHIIIHSGVTKINGKVFRGYEALLELEENIFLKDIILGKTPYPQDLRKRKITKHIYIKNQLEDKHLIKNYTETPIRKDGQHYLFRIITNFNEFARLLYKNENVYITISTNLYEKTDKAFKLLEDCKISKNEQCPMIIDQIY